MGHLSQIRILTKENQTINKGTTQKEQQKQNSKTDKGNISNIWNSHYGFFRKWIIERVYGVGKTARMLL